ncbi:bifunctional serine/threonine protein kinase/MFS transporter [Streptomyces sp. NBC_00536]|uniref:bifunctional serine/threonine protein kinase/MFS transporter n=1 Tax=Streptomyces sp. NBC_00536 TaxID=2975769 RepID=UPI002E81AF1C|nr:bifunctional serine/threonine protein kinase/MFS transporter [Streptomyces sp. NBC_00536]WUC76977.1 bifunctional serine/threonine protein kinase/MFS transporter [Streptomyces sp. NBC_00536]
MDSLTVEDPTYIGPYRLIARLGAGGMGLVYLGRDEVGRTVAVKVVQAEYAAHPEFRKRFAREVAAARRVGGSWTADVLDANTDAGVAVPWVATQYIAGPDLTTVVARDFGPLPEHSVRVLASRLALALEAVHAAGLIHRDLKPSNVLVTVDGPRVIDFGIARAMDSLGGDSLHTRTGMLIGSPGFMSPEQVRGLPLTPASDVFCLGAVLVYAATGRLLFGATDTGLNAHLFRIAEEDPDLTGVPDSLLPLVRACLAKNPAQRPTPAQIAEHTAEHTGGDGGGVWLPGEVLVQLGRHAAQLLDYVPAARPEAAIATPVTESAPARTPAPGYTPTAPDRGTPAPVPRRRWHLAVIALAQLAVLLGATYQESFRASMVSSDFVIFFTVPFAALLLLGGHIVDRVGSKRTLVTGLAGLAAACALGSAFGGLHSWPLFLARTLQGGFGALVTTAALALVTTGLPEPKERVRAFGIYATVSVGGPILGLLLARDLGWGLPLAISALLALTALAGTRALPPDRPDRPDRTDTRFDLPGALLSVLGIAGLVYGPLEASASPDGSAAEKWRGPLIVLPIAGGVILLLAFLRWQRSASNPLLPRYVLQDRARLGGFLTMFLAGAGILSLTPVMARGIVLSHGYSTVKAWLAVLPLIAAIAIGATQISLRLLRRGMTPGMLIVTGLVITPIGSVLTVVTIEAEAGYPAMLPCMILAGLGIGLVLMPVVSAATTAILPQHAGAAAAAVIAAQLVGKGIGTALVSTIHAPPWWDIVCLLLAGLTAARMVRQRNG